MVDRRIDYIVWQFYASWCRENRLEGLLTHIRLRRNGLGSWIKRTLLRTLSSRPLDIALTYIPWTNSIRSTALLPHAMMGFSTEPYSRVSLEENGLTEDPLLPTLEKVADNENRSDERMAWKAPIKYLISSKKNPWLLHLVILLTYTTIYLYMQIQLVKGTKKIQDLIYSEYETGHIYISISIFLRRTTYADSRLK